MNQELLSHLPKMDVLLTQPLLVGSGLPRAALKAAARSELDALRRRIQSGQPAPAPSMEEIARAVLVRAQTLSRPSLRPVINATGVVLHTNLGRAPMSPAAAEAACAAAAHYTNLEYDLDSRCRSSRGAHVEQLVCALTGAEAALVVNNNAAAVLLMLCVLAAGKGVALSRGELVEIGGSFRMPDIMARSGVRLVEVGTTNKTRLSDYEGALAAGTAQVLLKVHPSNFKVVGFTEEVPLAELAALARRHGVPVLCDLGSGAPDGDGPWPPDYPTAAGTAGLADVMCFSGDKLLGGPQAGILAGRKEYIDRLRSDPLARALRIDKLSLAALEVTLRAWTDPERRAALPGPAMLSAGLAQLRPRAEALAGRLAPLCAGWCAVRAVESAGEAGGGALPGVALPGAAVELRPADGDAEALERALRAHCPPILGRLHRGALLLDVRTLLPGDEEEIVRALAGRTPREQL